MSEVFVGIGGAHRNGSAAVCTPHGIVGVCEQERVTRAAAAGFNPSGLPDEALDELLRRSGRTRADIRKVAFAEQVQPDWPEPLRLEHHYAHACAAFLPSPFERALVVVCDHADPQISVWQGHGNALTPCDWPWQGMGFAELYSLCAETLGFNGRGREQRMEALARSQGPRGESPVVALFDVERDRLRVDPAWRVRVREMLEKGAHTESIRLAQALQHRIADLAIELLASMRERYPEFRHLCAGGSLFFNSHFNARLKLHGQFDDVFVPPNPGNAGIAVGAALHAAGPTRIPVSPFSGPAYSPEEIKGTLDNCKLTYQWASENETVAIAAQALYSGCLVAWFDGPMEWGTRALGNRSILANPFHPFVLENLNTFLKQREAWRGYALSGPTTVVREHFDGPASSPYMECDYQPKDPKRFRHVLPGDGAAVRIQTVGAEGPERFRALLDAFGRLSGLPMLVNTSFNGFREPIVCSPRDAIRVFYGTGADLLVLGHFVLRK